MVKVVISDNKGLVQSSGAGIEIENSGLECIKYGAVQSLNAADDYDDELVLPAGAMITDIGFVALTICTTANNGATDQIEFKAGTSAGGVDIVAKADVCEQNKSLVAGSGQSVSAGNKAEATANALATFANAALLRDAAGAARSVHTRFVVSTSALAAPGTVRSYVKYIVI
jgi:hypothetical protein